MASTRGVIRIDMTDVYETIGECNTLYAKAGHRLPRHTQERIDRMFAERDVLELVGLRAVPSETLLSVLVDLRVVARSE